MNKKIFILGLFGFLSSSMYADTFVSADITTRDVSGIYPNGGGVVVVEPGPTVSKQVIVTQETKKFKPGIISGTIRFVASGFNLVSHAIGSGLWDSSDALQAADVAPERIMRSDGSVIVVEQRAPTRSVIEYRNKCTYYPEVFNQIMVNDFKAHFGQSFKYLEVKYYDCYNGVYQAEIYATFNDNGGIGPSYTIQASAKSTDIEILKYLLREKVKQTRITVYKVNL